MKRQHGLSLTELLVALAIGAVLVFGATQVFTNSRKTYETNETVTRLQETARYAMSVLEPDVRLANYWGMVKGASAITGQAMEDEAPAAIADGAGANWCGNNLATDLNMPLKAYNNRYRFTDDQAPPADCDELADDLPSGASIPVGTADTLIIRRAAVTPTTAQDGVIQLCTNRQNGFLFSNGDPGGACDAGVYDPSAAIEDRATGINNLIMHAYYVDQNSDGRAGMPSLRRKSLIGDTIVDEEVIPGVEDMQVQLGIETGTNTPNLTPVNGEATQYLNPEQVDLTTCNCQIVSVRLWLLVRADAPEVGFTDDRTYTYAERVDTDDPTADLNDAGAVTAAYQPSADGEAGIGGLGRFRRLLVMRTIQIRNAWGT